MRSFPHEAYRRRLQLTLSLRKSNSTNQMNGENMTQHPSDGYAVELEKTDISPYRAGNIGLEGVTTFDSGEPGPHVAISAVVHGNELCGPIALDWLFKQGVRPVKGKLSLFFVNLDAYDRFDPADPLATRWADEDMNRLWQADKLEDDKVTLERTRARALRPFVDTIDLLLDIHSMQHKTAPLMLAGALQKGKDLARAVSVPEVIMCDKGHAAGKRLRDYDGFSDPASPKNALLIECGQHWEKDAGDVAIETSIRFLRATGAVAADFGQTFLDARPAPTPQSVVEIIKPVTAQTDNFRFQNDYRGMEVIEKAGTIIGYDGETPVTTPEDNVMMIMPSRRLSKGMTAVRLGRILKV